MSLRQLLVGAAGVAVAGALGWFDPPSDSPVRMAKASGDPVVNYAPDSQQMNEAILAAQATLPEFLAHALPDNGPSAPDRLVKVAFPADRGESSHEHIWVNSFVQTPDGLFRGHLANEPVGLTGLHLGSEVSFDRSMITDWMMFSARGLMHGAYTLRVIHADGGMGSTPFDQVFEENPVPTDWR